MDDVSVKNILLPLDFMADSPRVLATVLPFLRRIGDVFKLMLLTSYVVPLARSEQIVPTHDELRKQALARLQKVVSDLEAHADPKQLSFEKLVQMGTPLNVLTRVIQDHAIDCLLVGSSSLHTKDGTAHFANLTRQLRCPLVLLPEN